MNANLKMEIYPLKLLNILVKKHTELNDIRIGALCSGEIAHTFFQNVVWMHRIYTHRSNSKWTLGK